ncbi:MAG: hypothetical protein V2A73_21340 [Pseudomonadota bacterium]
MATEELKILVTMKDFASAAVKALGVNLKSMAMGAAGGIKYLVSHLISLPGLIAATASAWAASRVVMTAIKGIDMASEIEAISNGFASLTKGMGGSQLVLEALRRGTRGTVSDFRLMQIANKSMLLGVGQNAEEFEKIATMARRLGRAVGRDATEAFEDLTMGIGRESRLILDNLGIIVDAGEAYELYAAQLGMTVDALTDMQKRTAFVNATFLATEKMGARLGKDVWTLADAWGALSASLTNFRNEVLKSLIPLIQKAVEDLTAYIKENKKEIIAYFADWIEWSGKAADKVETLYKMVTKVGGAVKDTVGWFYKLGVFLGWKVRLAVGPGLQDESNWKTVREWQASDAAKQAVADAQANLDFAKEFSNAVKASNAPLGAQAKALVAVCEARSELIRVTREANSVQKESAAVLGTTVQKLNDASAAGNTYAEMAKKIADAMRAGSESVSTFNFRLPFSDVKTFVTWLEILHERRKALTGAAITDAQSLQTAMEKVKQLNMEVWGMDPGALMTSRANDFLLKRASNAREVEYLERSISERYRERVALQEREHANTEKYVRLRMEAARIQDKSSYDTGTGLGTTFLQMGDEAKRFGDIASRAVRDVQEALTSGLTDSLWDVMSMTEDAGEAFTKFAEQVVEDIGKIILQETIAMVIKSAMGGLGGLFGGAGGEVPFSMSMYGKKEGGVFPGHFVPVSGHFAGGDIARKRGLYELREGGQDEAVIPLSGNRYIPVKFTGDGQGGSSVGPRVVNQNVFNFNGDSRQFGRQLRENAETVAAIVVEKQNSSMRFREGMAA